MGVLNPYRNLLAVPHVRSLVAVTLLARIPATAATIVLTLHVVLSLGGGFAAAGLLGAATTVGGAVGAPLMGRLTDRRGLRLTLFVTGVAQAAFWLAAPVLPYPVLLPAALVSGLLWMPLFSVSRQSLAALVPDEQRRTAYSLDSMSVEVSFAVGPALGVLMATQVSTRAAMITIGTAMVAGGVLLWLLNPPIRSEAEEEEQDDADAAAAAAGWRWVSQRLVVVLVATAGALVVLAGTDVAIVATLQASGELSWSGLVIGAWCLASLAGGFVYGALPRTVHPLVLVQLLSLLTIPVGLATHWWALMLVIVPAGAMCAPTIAGTGELVSRLVPASVRGEAMGLHASALTAGMTLGAPLAGFAVDHLGPWAGFAACGVTGAALGLVALAVAPAARASSRARLALSGARRPPSP